MCLTSMPSCLLTKDMPLSSWLILRKGITQNQLSKELGVKGENIFYVVRQLECQGLIGKYHALERKRDICVDRKTKNQSSVTTNVIYLNPYAKKLGSQQRFEITKETQLVESLRDANGEASNRDGLAGEHVKTDIHVEDYSPQMKAIRDKLEKANGEVLVVSDIKKDLGYCGSPSQRKAWKAISFRLKKEHMEEFDAKVNNKIEACLRLLKPLASGYGGEGQKLKSGKKCQITEQLVELPIKYQIYDMIDAAGSEGLTSKMICKSFGITHKKNQAGFLACYLDLECTCSQNSTKKVMRYRFWTSRNFNPEPAIALVHTTNENKISAVHTLDKSGQNISGYDTSTFNENLDAPKEMEDTLTEVSCGCPGNIDPNHMVVCPKNLQKIVLDSWGIAFDVEHNLVSVAEIDIVVYVC